jgi:hypothetical protein
VREKFVYLRQQSVHQYPVFKVNFSKVLKLLPVIPNILPLQNAYKVRQTPVYKNKRNKKIVLYLLLLKEDSEILFLETRDAIF